MNQTSPPFVDRLKRSLPLAVLLALTVVLVSRGITDGGFRYSDASRHAMDGVFVHDFVRDAGTSLQDPVGYALTYYARYPALGIPLYYPPTFAVVEAAFFAVFGISVLTARLTVLAFALLAAAMTYKLFKSMFDPVVAFFGTALFLSLPDVVFWSRQVMLEMPTAATILSATYFFWIYVETRKPRHALAAGVLVVAAVLCKQPALYIVPAFGVYLFIRMGRDALKRWEVYAAAAIVAMGLIPYFVLTFRYTPLLTKQVGMAGAFGRLSIALGAWFGGSWAWLVVLMLLLMGVSTVLALTSKNRKGLLLLLLLLGSFFCETVALKAHIPRYIFIGLPFLAVFVPLVARQSGLLKFMAVKAALAAAIGVLAAFAYFQHIPAVRGYRELAQTLLEHNGESPFVFFDGFRDGDIVFYVRQRDPHHRRFVLRGGKMLYTYASFPWQGAATYVEDRAALHGFLDRFAIQVVALEDRQIHKVEPGTLLREEMERSDRFAEVGRQIIDAPGTKLDGLNVILYARHDTAPATVRRFKIPLPGLGLVIRVTLDEHGNMVGSPCIGAIADEDPL